MSAPRTSRLAAMAAHAREVAALKRQARMTADRMPTVRELAHSWLAWVEQVKGAKPSTVADYRFLIREPGIPHKRGAGTSHGRIMAALGDRPATEVTTAEVSAFLRSLDQEGLTPRNVNKHRDLLGSIFSYGCRSDTLGLQSNPVDHTDNGIRIHLRRWTTTKSRKWKPWHVRVSGVDIELERQVGPMSELPENGEDRRDADTFRLLFYTGLRLGVVLTVRWADVDLTNRVLLVRRGLSGGRRRCRRDSATASSPFRSRR